MIVVNAFARALVAPDYPDGLEQDVVSKLMDDMVNPEGSDDFDVVTEVAPSLAADEKFQQWWDAAGRRGASPTTARALLQVALLSDLRDTLPQRSRLPPSCSITPTTATSHLRTGDTSPRESRTRPSSSSLVSTTSGGPETPTRCSTRSKNF